MATFKTCVQTKVKRTDGFYPVYIRVTQNRKVAYIKTNKLVNEHGLSKSMEVTDPIVMQYCMKQIVTWIDMLNRLETENWTVKEVVQYLNNGSNDVCFSDYARTHHDRMVDRGEERNARNYELAYQHLERFAGTNKVPFSMLTSAFLNKWILSLNSTHRAKELYPICIRQIFKSAIMEFNDEERGIVKIKFNPWYKVEIPQADRPEKLAITPEDCRAFFYAPIPESKLKSPLAELGRDVAMMVICLGGINTVDLFNLTKENYYDGIIHYQRAKTKKFRADGAYMEMRVPPILLPVVDKYLSHDDSEPWLFTFHQRHSSSDSFGANVNSGIKRVCESMGIPKDDWYCVYTFRHTWGTVAQNDCGASISDVAFGMNHSSGHKITRGYIKLDFTKAFELNEKVIDLIFFTEKISNRESETEREKNTFERFSHKTLIHGEVFFKGRKLGEFTDVGFSNVDEVIRKLANYVSDEIPNRSMVLFRVENTDKKQVQVYQRMKGKGF